MEYFVGHPVDLADLGNLYLVLVGLEHYRKFCVRPGYEQSVWFAKMVLGNENELITMILVSFLFINHR